MGGESRSGLGGRLGWSMGLLAAAVAAACAYLAFRPAPSLTLLEMARAGQVAAIYATADQNPSSSRDLEAYKWLAVAHDFGHDAAQAAMEDLQVLSSLRYDDDQLAVSTVHHELGLAYLTAAEGLPQDLAKANQHFELAAPGMAHVKLDLAADRAKLSGQALQLFNRFYPPQPAAASAAASATANR